MITTMRQILEHSAGTSYSVEQRLKNPRYMAAMAKELKILGFTPAIRQVRGKRRRVWISADEVHPADLVRAAVFAADPEEK